MDKTSKKIMQFKPVEKGRYGTICECYSHLLSRDNKPLKLILDSKNRLIYCDHCGNLIDPFIALELLCKNWQKLQDAQDDIRKRLLRSWEIGRKYRPWKRAIKDLEKLMGRRGENLPCCPHCDKPFHIEDITNFRCAPNGHSVSGYKLGNFNRID